MIYSPKFTTEDFPRRIYKEEAYPEAIYYAKLSNGVRVGVKGDFAEGEDGKIYYNVSRMRDDLMITLGWSSEIDKPVVFDDGAEEDEILIMRKIGNEYKPVELHGIKEIDDLEHLHSSP